MFYATRSMHAAVAVVTAGLLVSSAHAAATIYNLGTFGGTYGSSSGQAINDSGQVAGYCYNATDEINHAFLYTGTPGSGGTMTDLGTLGGTSSWGKAINNSGQVAGYSVITGSTTASHAFRYSGGTMTGLGTFGVTSSYGQAINASGQVAGWSYMASGPTWHAFRYSGTPGSGGSMADLGTFSGIESSNGFAINASGQVAGTSDVMRHVSHAFLYTGTPGNGGMMTDLGTLGGTNSDGFAINASGQVAGWSELANGEQHAFRYTSTPGSVAAMVDLGTLGGLVSCGKAISTRGQVAGWSYTTGYAGQHAFLYTGTPGVDGQMIDLDAWLDATNPGEGAKWTLTAAYGMNDSGLITGEGVYNDGPAGLSDGTRAFVLDASSLVPEPGSLSLLTLAVAGLTLRRHRRQV